jgi:hypothetical protein
MSTDKLIQFAKSKLQPHVRPLPGSIVSNPSFPGSLGLRPRTRGYFLPSLRDDSPARTNGAGEWRSHAETRDSKETVSRGNARLEGDGLTRKRATRSRRSQRVDARLGGGACRRTHAGRHANRYSPGLSPERAQRAEGRHPGKRIKKKKSTLKGSHLTVRITANISDRT